MHSPAVSISIQRAVWIGAGADLPVVGCAR
jgi:hypothetical protein